MSQSQEAPEMISVVGTITRDAELGRTDRGKLYTRLHIAADEVTIDGQKADPAANKWQNAVFWGIDAKDKASLKQGTQVSITGERLVRQVERRDGSGMQTFAEIHRGELEVLKVPKERPPGVPIDMKAEVLYDPEFQSTANGQFYTRVHLRPENGGEKMTATFWGQDAEDVARSLRKGAPVAVKGELVVREYEKGGNPVKAFEVAKPKLEVLEQGRSRPRSSARQQQQSQEMER
jgi:single-stranded DNA-binding protein